MLNRKIRNDDAITELSHFERKSILYFQLAKTLKLNKVLYKEIEIKFRNSY